MKMLINYTRFPKAAGVLKLNSCIFQRISRAATAAMEEFSKKAVIATLAVSESRCKQ
jgi:hypothetical protein